MNVRPIRKSVFDEKAQYTDLANKIDSECGEMMTSLFNKWAGQGYSPRDIFSIAVLSASEVMAIEMLTREVIKEN